MLGVFGWGFPALAIENAPVITLYGQIVGAVVFFLVGFVPGYACAYILKKLGMLRVPAAAEEAGLDTVKVPAQGYPEGIVPSGPASS